MSADSKKWESLVNRRLQPRLDVDLPVTLRYDGRLIPATALNISAGGMSLSVPERPFRADSQVEVIFDLDATDKDVTVRGKILRYEDNEAKRVGLQFVNLFTVGHKAIERYLKKKFSESVN